MDTYALIIALQRALMKDFKDSTKSSTFKDSVKETIEQLNNLKTFY